MKLTKSYMAWIIILLLAAVWNILCLTAILPANLYTLSFIFVMLAYGASIAWRFYTSKQGGHTNKDNTKPPISGLLLCAAIAWVITHIACLVYPW